MLKVFVTGLQGSGKTTIAEKLAAQGFLTVDSDTLSRWVDKTGRPLAVKRPANPTTAWLREHAWVWSQEKLRAWLSADHNHLAVLCGLSWDQEKYYDLFDKVILLEIDKQTATDRLLHRSNGSIFGKQPQELQFILEKLDSFQAQAKAAGAICIDARQPIDEVVQEIVQCIRRIRGGEVSR